MNMLYLYSGLGVMFLVLLLGIYLVRSGGNDKSESGDVRQRLRTRRVRRRRK